MVVVGRGRTQTADARPSSSSSPTLSLSRPSAKGRLSHPMDPDGPPPSLILSPLLHDLSTWLSLPDGPPASAVGVGASAASSFISAGRQATGFLNLLPGGRQQLPPPPQDVHSPPRQPKKVRCRAVEAYGKHDRAHPRPLPLHARLRAHPLDEAQREHVLMQRMLDDRQATICTWERLMGRCCGTRLTMSARRP